jgi:hypothetical protein
MVQSISNKKPNSPTSLAYTVNSATINQVVISFTAPTNVTIISYTASSGPSSGTPAAYTVSGLASNTTYNLTLVANGVFKSSVASSPALSILTKPGAPTIGTATVSNTTASVVFTAPTGNGIITSYTVTSNTGGFTNTGASSPISVTGLTAGSSYTFTVTATNASGTSTASSASNSITAVAVAVGVGYVSPVSVTNMILWLDAYDPNATGTIPSSSTPLSSWKDRSGNSNNSSYDTGGTNTGATVSTNQWDNNTLNGAPSVYLYGNARYWGNFTAIGSKLQIFAVVSLSSTSQHYGRLIGMGNGDITTNGNDPLAFCRQGNTTFDLQRPNSGLVNDKTNMSYSNPYIWEVWYDGTSAYTSVLQGSGTTIKSTAYSANLGYNLFSIGSAPSRNDNTVGYFSEILIYSRALTTTERQQVEGYLSLKWGLNANLPSTHPYYNSAFFSNNCSSLVGWVNNGFTVATVGGQTCFTGSSNSYYVYVNSGATTLKGRTISFNVYLTGGCPNFYFNCNSTGTGQMLRFEQRSSSGSGFTGTSSWTGWSGPSSTYTWTQNTWLAITIPITSAGVATFTVNGVASGITYTIADNGRYIGLQADGGGGSISVNNIVIN